MTISLPLEMQQALAARAARRHTTPDALVHEALAWYFQIEEGLLDELAAWQEIRDEALEIAEAPPP